MLRIGFEIAINLFQAFLFVYFVRRKFRLKHPELRYAVLTGVGAALFLSLYLWWDVPATDTFVLLFPACYALAVADHPKYAVLFWMLVYTVLIDGVIQLTTNLFLFMPGSSWELMLGETPLRISYVVSGNLGCLIVTFLLSGRLDRDILSVGSMALLVLLECLFCLLNESLYRLRLATSGNDARFIAASVCVLGCAFLSLLLYEMLRATAAKQRALETAARTAEMTRRHAEELRDMYANLTAQQHDLKQQYQIVRAMLASGHGAESEAFLAQLPAPELPQAAFFTGCVAVDALLTIKKLAMDRAGAAFHFQPYPLDALPIPESDFCALLSNLLDNAVEAVSRSPDANRSVSLALARSWSIFFITCENTADPAQLKLANGQLVSSKADPLHHGYGIRNIRAIVDRASGSYRCAWRDGVFRTEILLPFPEEAAHPREDRATDVPVRR